MSIGLEAYLIVAAILFVFGALSCVRRRNAVGILIGIELILNASILNFMAFWRFASAGAAQSGLAEGPLMGVFLIVLAACEAAVALAVLLNLYFNFGTINVDYAHGMKH